MPLLPRRLVIAIPIVLLVLTASCGGGSASPKVPASPFPPAAPTTTAVEPTQQPCDVCKPQVRSGLGDVDTAFARYGATRGEYIDLIKAQSWYKDGLTRDESLFIERSLSYLS